MCKILKKFTASGPVVGRSLMRRQSRASGADYYLGSRRGKPSLSFTLTISPMFRKLGTDPNVTTAIPSRNFRKSVTIGDIVAVNGQPTKGTFVGNFRQIFFRPGAPTPGQAIADITRNSILEFWFEILNIDGTPIGAIMAAGLGTGSAPPGAPRAVTQGNVAIVGGTGSVSRSTGPIPPDSNRPNYCGPAGINE